MSKIKNKKYSFSIIIPCRNEKYYISQCVNSILAQNYNKNLIEIIIVDGLSDDGTKEIVENLIAKNSNIKLYNNPDKKTPKALNIGVKKSKNDIIIILGAHTELDSNFVSLNNKFHSEKNIKVTGGTQLNVGKTFKQKLIATVMEIPFGMASAKYRWSNKEQFVDTVVYAAYRRELFDELGNFEEKFAISEDAEFNWRVRKAGYKIFYSPKIKSKYYPRKSIGAFLKQLYRYGILRVNVIKKHFDSIKFYHLIPPIFVLSLLFLLVFSIFYNISFFVLLFLLTIYFLTSFFTSLPKLKGKKKSFFILVPLLIFFMHISWGTGFLVGAILPKSEKY
ncbi:MAG: succinoglycan biosynthesis protein exoa [Ignavibacteriae bacterium]|nr:MAG: succinoglycan biosynthesis protein exoa [Ignavibacteriota bacterium]